MEHAIMSAPGTKLLVYETLSSMNKSFEQVVRDLREFECLGLLEGNFLEACRDKVEELRAEINRKLTEILNLQETQDAKAFERKRLQWERSQAETNP